MFDWRERDAALVCGDRPEIILCVGGMCGQRAGSAGDPFGRGGCVAHEQDDLSGGDAEPEGDGRWRAAAIVRSESRCRRDQRLAKNEGAGAAFRRFGRCEGIGRKSAPGAGADRGAAAHGALHGGEPADLQHLPALYCAAGYGPVFGGRGFHRCDAVSADV